MLIVYYSISNGNTKAIAKKLQDVTGADISAIDTIVKYSDNYDDVVSQGQKEVNEGFEPELKDLDFNVDNYDVVAIGTPTWWYTMAPAVLTFLHQCNFNGKIVIPFATHGGWPGHVLEDIEKACKGAEIKESFDIYVDVDTNFDESKVDKWVDNVKSIL